MATLYSTEVTANEPARAETSFTEASGTFSLAAALALNDVVQMVTVPEGAVILDVILSASDLDTATSQAIVLDVGLTGVDADLFIDGATVGQGGGITRMNNIAGNLYEMTSEDTIDVLVQVGPGTGATSGTIKLTVFYTMRG